MLTNLVRQQLQTNVFLFSPQTSNRPMVSFIVKVTPVGSFADSDSPEDVAEFFDDELNLKLTTLSSEDYSKNCQFWVFSYLSESSSCDALPSEDTEFDMGSTIVKLQLHVCHSSLEGHELCLSIHPPGGAFPVEDVLNDLFEHFDDSFNIKVEDRGDNKSGCSVWRVWAPVTSDELPSLLGQVELGRYTVMVSLPPKFIRIQLLNEKTGAPLTSETMTAVGADVFIRTIKRRGNCYR